MFFFASDVPSQNKEGSTKIRKIEFLKFEIFKEILRKITRKIKKFRGENKEI